MGVITLKDVFEKKDTSQLKALISAYGVGKSRIKKKDKLIDICIEAVCREGVFEEHALLLPKISWEFYKEVAESANGLFCHAKPLEYMISEKLGYLYVEEYDDKCYFVVPREIQVIYDKLKEDGFIYFKECSDLINDYATAAVNLYGIISEEELVEIFNAQNEDETTLEINRTIFIKHMQYGTDYCLWKDYIVHKDLQDNDFEDAEGLIKDISGKMRYIPPKEEFLRYADWNYYENSRQLIELSKFLINKCGVSDVDINNIMFDLHWEFSGEFFVPRYFEVLDKYEVTVEEEQVEKLIALMVNCCNHTRLWSNKGYTPQEYAGLSHMPKKKETKIGRNDPCPCGSGKKYKKCCGR